jgi:hypothetical protein
MDELIEVVKAVRQAGKEIDVRLAMRIVLAGKDIEFIKAPDLNILKKTEPD